MVTTDPVQAAEDYMKANNISGLLQVRSDPVQVSRRSRPPSSPKSVPPHSLQNVLLPSLSLRGGRVARELLLTCVFISPLLQILTASLIYHKPNDVNSHLVDILRQMQLASQVEEDADLSLASTNFVGCLFSDEDLSTMFNMYDMNNTGTMSKDQAMNAVENLVGPAALETLELSRYLGDQRQGAVTQLQFTEACKYALHKVLTRKGSEGIL